MRVAYCSLLLPEEMKIAERCKSYLSGTSLHRFTKAVIEGVDSNLNHPVKVFNIINTLNYPKFPELIFKTETWQHTDSSQDWHIGYINLFGIKYITQAFQLYKKLLQWKKDDELSKDIICVHNTYFPSMIAAYFIKCKFRDRIKLCLITGDVPGRHGLISQKKNGFKQRMIFILEKLINRLVPKFDCFAFATGDMAKAFGVDKKAYVVLECTYMESGDDQNSENNTDSEQDQKIIFYAGSIREEYGIIHLLNAFSMIRDKSYKLWIAGGGQAESVLKQYIEKDSRIEYLGFLSIQEVTKRQKMATVLISPRTSEHDFVRYSFPSKTMECLASGKPYIAHKLPCEPPEYAEYIQYPDDESDEALKDKMMEVCEKPLEERRLIGKKARDFILNEKNPHVMCKRIVDMWKDVSKE